MAITDITVLSKGNQGWWISRKVGRDSNEELCKMD